MEIEFKLSTFEGPLDLLLHLIARHKLDICDIEISLLLEQYLAFIENAPDNDLEYAGEFLEMAARLVYIKTAALLPHPEEAQTLKKELEGALIEYSLCKQAAEKLKLQNISGEIFTRPPMQIKSSGKYSRIYPPMKLYEAYMGISAKTRNKKPIRKVDFAPLVSKRYVSVTSKVLFVLKKLYHTGKCKSEEIYNGLEDKSSRIAAFLAILELTKAGRIYFSQEDEYIIFNRPPKKERRKSEQLQESVQEQPQEPIGEQLQETAPEQPQKPVQEQLQECVQKPEKNKPIVFNNNPFIKIANKKYIKGVNPMNEELLKKAKEKLKKLVEDGAEFVKENISSAIDTAIDTAKTIAETVAETINENITQNRKNTNNLPKKLYKTNREIMSELNPRERRQIWKNGFNRVKQRHTRKQRR